MENYIRGQSHHMLHICVDNYCDCGIKGRIFNDTLKENVLFTDIHHIFLECENLFDRNGNPLSSQQKRSFQKGKEKVLCTAILINIMIIVIFLMKKAK